eukprot:g5388.t1
MRKNSRRAHFGIGNMKQRRVYNGENEVRENASDSPRIKPEEAKSSGGRPEVKSIKRRVRPKSAPASRGGRRKKRTMSDVEEEVARREILALAGAPLTHDEKVQKLHKYTWNQFQAAHVDGASILPPGRQTANAAALTRKASTERLGALAIPRKYRLRQKAIPKDNAPFRTSGGRGLLAELGYVTGLGSSKIGIGHQAIMLEDAIDPSKPRNRFSQKATSGSDLVSKISNYQLLEHHVEYQNLQEGEVCVIILHCSHCKNHQRTTRHKQEQFEAYALKMEQALRHVLPESAMIIRKKVGLRLIGAFEVQICRRRRNILEKRLLHSRIVTGAWPKVKEVAQRAMTFVPTFTFSLLCQTTCDEALSEEISRAFCGLEVSLLNHEGTTVAKVQLVEDGFEPRSQAQSDQKTRFSSVANIELCQDDVVKIKNLEVGNVNCHESIFVPIREHVDLTTGVEKTGVSFERVLCRQRRFVVSLEGKARDVVATASEVAESLVEFEIKDMSPECGHLRTFRSDPCTSGPSKAYHITVPTSFHAMKKIR